MAELVDNLDSSCRSKCLGWMAAICLAGGHTRAAEGYLLELLAWCAFGDRRTEEELQAVPEPKR